ncbi:MAG TPA: winged helix-turn-helix domain-containing protein [Sphingomicrobium sp.]|nr:winged helix-turn-helix domain-containing protein [Sphingomicrobium sp.]
MNRAVVLPLHGIDLNSEPPFRVGGASVDPHSRDATFVGGQERLQPQVLKVLIALARRRGEVVTRDELVAFCWDGRVIGDDVINRAVLVLRQFAKKAGGFRIETVPKAGYRLRESDEEQQVGTRPLASLLVVLPIIAAVLAIGAAIYWFINRSPSPDPPVPTISIVPLDLGQADPAAREFASQVRGQLAHKLSEGGFPIRLVDSASDKDIRASGLIISGEVRRQVDAYRATVRIEQPARRVIVYSQQFESSGTDARILPERIGAQIAAALSWTGALLILDPRYQTNPAILADLFKNTILIVQGGDVLQSYEIARRLAPRAPGSPMAQLSLAFNTSFALERLPLAQRPAAINDARQAANRAVQLAPYFGDVYATWCFLHSPVRLGECEDRLRTAMRLDPDASFVGSFLSGQLNSTGNFSESLELARQSLSNDRFKLWKIGRVLRALETKGDVAEAEVLHRQAERWWPGHPALFWNRWAGKLVAGDYAGMERLEGELPARQRTPAELFAGIRRGDPALVGQSCAKVQAQRPHLCMVGLAAAGDFDGAYAIADTIFPRLRGRTAAEEEAMWIRNAGGAPLAFLSGSSGASLRTDPRFLLVAERVGLLGYWRSGRLPDFCKVTAEPVCARLRTGPKLGRFADPKVESFAGGAGNDPFTRFSLAGDEAPRE